MLLKGVFHRLYVLNIVWILDLLLKGLDDCILKSETKEVFKSLSVFYMCFGITETKIKRRKSSFGFWVSLNMHRKTKKIGSVF